MLPMPIADHQAIAEELAASGKYVKVLWQSEDTLMFAAGNTAANFTSTRPTST